LLDGSLMREASRVDLVQRLRADFRAAPATVARMRDLVAGLARCNFCIATRSLCKGRRKVDRARGVANLGRAVRARFPVDHVFLALLGCHPKLGPSPIGALEKMARSAQRSTPEISASGPGNPSAIVDNQLVPGKKAHLSGFPRSRPYPPFAFTPSVSRKRIFYNTNHPHEPAHHDQTRLGVPARYASEDLR